MKIRITPRGRRVRDAAVAILIGAAFTLAAGQGWIGAPDFPPAVTSYDVIGDRNDD